MSHQLEQEWLNDVKFQERSLWTKIKLFCQSFGSIFDFYDRFTFTRALNIYAVSKYFYDVHVSITFHRNLLRGRIPEALRYLAANIFPFIVKLFA